MLDAAAPLPHSRLKPLVLYAAIGLIVGLVLGMAIVVIRALCCPTGSAGVTTSRRHSAHP